MKPRIQHDRLVKWIKDPETSPTRRRLYMTMLGIGGSAADIPMLEEMIVSGYEDQRPLIEPAVAGSLAMGGPLDLPTWGEFVKVEERRKKLGMDALVACYLVLRGPDGMNLIDEKILKPKNAGYSQEVYSAIMAIRFLGEETKIVPRERLLVSMRLLLDNPEFADQVITDLSRWEDWSVLDRLVTMFKNPSENSYIRPPIVAYMLAAMEQPNAVGERAKAAMAEFETVDPETTKRAKATAAFGFLQRARSVSPATGNLRPELAAASPVATAKSAADSSSTPAASAAAGTPIKSPHEPVPPDPATFTAHAAVPRSLTSKTEGDGKTDVATTASPATTAALIGTGSEAAATSVVTTVTPATPAAAEASASLTQNLLVVGVPFAVALLLIGVYWMILRSGAV